MAAAVLLFQPFASVAAPDPRGDIDAANKRFINALASSNLAAVADDYEDSGEFVNVRADVVGRKNLERFFANRTSPGRFESGSCRSTHLSVSSDTAIEQGGCSLVFIMKNGRPKTSVGGYVTVWKYHPERSRWLIHTNIVLP